MTKRRPEALGELETTVMNVAWQRASVTARDVFDTLTGAKGRAYTTIMTTLDRLHRKGMLIREKDGLAWRYAAALSKAEFERALADGLAAKILSEHGDAGLSAFVDAAANIDEALLVKLRHLIDLHRKGTP
ncbi:MAG: BlaI/MecI/CopY family transcriptional regulator [Deltaproteobacteria bacterium]|nr:BlaI/MecI/CopY family transcriptional regulator [Deltaproteobacteria bacterium]